MMNVIRIFKLSKNVMSKYKRNQQGQLRNTNQDWRNDEDWRQDLNRRGEDVYGEGEDYRGEGYRNPNKPPFPIPYAENPRAQHRPSGFRYNEREDEDLGNYGRGGYYGLTYDQENYNRDRRKQRMGFGQNYQRVDERDYGRDRRWGPERLAMPGYRSDEDGRYGVTGIHKGKGPRGYQRSDERIKDDINDHLADDSFIDASDVEVNVKDSEVTLIGTVESRDAKRRAEDIGESVSGVKNVENRLRVKRNTDWTNRDGNSEDRTIGTQRSNVREAIR
jgi:hypothetical protein